MSEQAKSSLEVKSWNEKPYNEEGEAKLVRAEVVYGYHGDLEGEGKVEYLMCYSTNNIAYFTGYERITGTLGGRSGSFVLHHHGTYEGGAVKATINVVPGSATGALTSLSGTGNCGGDSEVLFNLTYDLA